MFLPEPKKKGERNRKQNQNRGGARPSPVFGNRRYWERCSSGGYFQQ